MKKVLLFSLLFTLIFSCTKEENGVIANSEFETENACTAGEPLELNWIQDLKEELNCGEYACEVSILKSEYESETVFYVQMTDPLCYGFSEIDLYNCNGEIIKEFTKEESSSFVNNEEHEFEKIFSCNG